MITAILILAALTSDPPPAPGSVGAEPDGKALFHGKGMCFTCHGAEGAGTAIGPALNDGEWLHFDEPPDADRLAALVGSGVTQLVRFPAPMPPRGGSSLSDEEIRAVTAYVLSLSSGTPASGARSLSEVRPVRSTPPRRPRPR